ncbi:MAG: hypothetical protein U0271_18400 [Polyangiaceae bacterium]
MTARSYRTLSLFTALAAVLALSGCTQHETDGTGGTTPENTGGAGGSDDPGGGDVGPACASNTLLGPATFAPAGGPNNTPFQSISVVGDVLLASTGTGIHRSLDGGATWAALENVEVRGQTVYALAGVPGLGEEGEFFASINGLTYHSADSGETWELIPSQTCGGPSYMTVRGSDLYAVSAGAVVHWNAELNDWEGFAPTDQFFDVVDSDGDYLYANSLCQPGVYKLSLHDANPRWDLIPTLTEWGYRAFAFEGTHKFVANQTQVLRSDDGGVDWKVLDLGRDVMVSDFLVKDGAIYATTGDGLMFSTDHGDTWQDVPAGASFSTTSLAANSERVFAAADGILATTSPTSEWTRLPVLADSIYWLVTTDKALFAYTTGGILRSADGGATWTRPTRADGSDLMVWVDENAITSLHGKVFMPGSGAGLLVSEDDGATFTEQPLPFGLQNKFINVVASVNDNLVIGITSGAGVQCSSQDFTSALWSSNDDGATWVPLPMSSLPRTFTDCYNHKYTPWITSLSEAGGALIATTAHDGAFLSVDHGINWQQASAADVGPRGRVTRLEAASDEPMHLFAPGAAGGVVRSDDAGASWEPSGLEGLYVGGVASSHGVLFASVSPGAYFFGEVTGAEGVYVSIDEGHTWSVLDGDFAQSTGPLAVVDGALFAGTGDESVWVAPLGCE